MSIERKAISALKWASIAKLVSQAVSWAGTLVVIRLLNPGDYGLMAMVVVVSSIAGTIAELGLGTAIVRSAEISNRDLQKIAGVSLVFGAVVTALVAAASPLFAAMFDEPRLTWPIAAASLQILIGSVAIIPAALWTRDLSFKSLAKIEMATGTIGIVATVVLALFGAGVWALVLGTLLAAVVRSAALLVTGQRVRPLFSMSGIAEHLKFGLTLVSNRLTYTVVSQSDILIGGIFLSAAHIGYYSVGLQLATLPMTKVMGTINQILLPMMARQQHEPARARQSLLKSVGLMATVSFPTLWGISAVAPEIVHVVLGDQWQPAIGALTLLPLIVPVRMTSALLYTTSLALGNRALDLRNTIVNLIFLPSGFLVGAQWGVLGLCWAWLLVVPLTYSFTMPSIMRALGVSARELFAQLLAPCIAATAMYATVWALRSAFDVESGVVALLALSAAGAVAYVACMALVSRKHLTDTLKFARSMTSKSSEPQPEQAA